MGDPRSDLTEYIRTKKFTPNTMLSARQLVLEIEHETQLYKTLAGVPPGQQTKACTIIAADQFKLPVSTTHVRSSGVAGTMVASGSGLQWETLRNIAMAWVLTLPVAALLSGCLFWVFRHFRIGLSGLGSGTAGRLALRYYANIEIEAPFLCSLPVSTPVTPAAGLWWRHDWHTQANEFKSQDRSSYLRR